MTTEAPWRLTYHDGSGNGFRFWQASADEAAQFAYDPVRPETSSSGQYSGGEPRQGILLAEQVGALWQWAWRLETTATLHSRSRVMGSGALRFSTPEEERSFMIRRSPLLQDFEAFLRPFRGT